MTKIIFFSLSHLIFILTSSDVYAEYKLKPFATDGCTLFVDGTPRKPGLWRSCCVTHDLRYWFGGSQMDMDSADLSLKSCVQNLAGESWARTIYTGVRAGHYSPIKNKTAWSWGWVTKREKIPLNEMEIIVAKAELRLLKLDHEKISIDDFIKINFPEAK